MSLSTAEFWKLVIESQLLTPQQCQSLGTEYGRVKGAAQQDSAKTLAQWLISRKALTQYQTTILLAGRSGPFQYGEYRVYDMVNKGRLTGMFRAVHTQTNHPVMLQFLTGPDIQDPNRWAQLAARLKNRCGVVQTHLQRAFEVVDLTTFKFLVLEDLRGESLEQRLAGTSAMEPGEACRLVRQASLALAQLHQAGQIHGDVRPYNLLLDQHGNIKLLQDPNLALGPVNLGQPDATGQLLSRADYMAPEMAQPGKTPDMLTDIYSLGCTLFHLLTGQAPFIGGDAQHKLQRHASEPIQPLEPLGVPPALSQLVAYSMAKNPEVRYQQAMVVGTQLASFIPPDRLNTPVAAPPQTLPVFENAILMKQSRLAAPSAPTAGSPSFPAVGGSSAPAGPSIVVDDTPLHQRSKKKAKSPAKSTSAPAITGVDTSVAAKTTPADAEKKKKMMLIGGFSAFSAVVLLGGILFAVFGGSDKEDPDDKQLTKVKTEKNDTKITPKKPPKKNTDNKNTPEIAYQNIVKDDGKLLWSSPTEGDAVKLDDVPRNAQIYLIVRPAEMLAEKEGPLVMQALGPSFAALRTQWERASGFKLEEVEQLIIALHDNLGTMPRPSFVVRLRKRLSQQDLLARWGNPSPEIEGGEKTYNARDWTFLIPDGGGKRFVMGSAEEIKDVIEFKGAPPTLRRQLEMLRKVSDDQRHFTALFAPNYLFSGGRALFSGSRQKIIEPLSQFLGDGLIAGSLSMHLDDSFFVEMRMIGQGEKDRHTLASEFRDRLEQVPSRIENYIDRLYAPPYWSKMARRFPLMIEYLHDNTRIGVTREDAVINAVLHPTTAHHFFFGSEMVIASAPGAGGTVAVAKPKGPKTVEEVMASKTSLSFGQTSLEFAVRDLATEANDIMGGLPFTFKIQIIGADLEKDGITRNQQIRDFKEEDKTVAEILTAMVMKANPITTVKEPSEKDQKLLWVIQPDPNAAGKKMVLVTTRAASEEKGYQLPEIFQVK